MLPFLGYSRAVTVALLSSPLASTFVKNPTIAIAVAMTEKSDTNASRIAKSVRAKNDLKRNLFDLASPFDFENDQCARECSSRRQENEANGEGLLINSCPRCEGRYTPCNFCCYQGASSLKLRFFGCPGNTSLVLSESLDDNGCSDLSLHSTLTNDQNTGVQFVDCDCFDSATDTASASFGDIASCPVFTHHGSAHASTTSDATASYLEMCIVSTTDDGNGPVANFSQPLPDIVGLKHVPNNTFGDVVTYFETSCDEKGVDSNGKFAYPLFPGYGKFAGTCYDHGFIDFENEESRLPDDVIFLGEPPSTSVFYQFIDGTSAGFWPTANVNNGDNEIGDSLFFDPTFANCECRECIDLESFIPTNTPSSNPTSDPLNPSDGTPRPPTFFLPSDIPSPIPSAGPSMEIDTTIDPTTLPPPELSINPSHLPSGHPSESPSVSPSDTYFPSIAPSNIPSKSSVPSIYPTSNPTRFPTGSPSTHPSALPSDNPSELPSMSSFPSIAPSNVPSKSPIPSILPSSNPSRYPTEFPTTRPSALPSNDPSVSPSGSYFPSIAPSGIPSNSHEPSDSPSSNPSKHPTIVPTTHPSLLPSDNPSGSPSGSYFPSIVPSNIPSKSSVPSSSPSTIPSQYPTESQTRPLIDEVPSANPSEVPTTLGPVIYRCSPTTSPNHANSPDTPSPIYVSNTMMPAVTPSAFLSPDPPSVWTESPTNFVSTEFPTAFPTSFPTSLTGIPTEENADCVDETNCFVFAVNHCVDKYTENICIPLSRRALEEQIEFHQVALAELQQI